MYPAITETAVDTDSVKQVDARNLSTTALVNKLMRESIATIENDNRTKNGMIGTGHFFNPITFFQNRFNSISETHYSDSQNYRDEIQGLIDLQIRTMVSNTLNSVKVDKGSFLDYHEALSQ